MNTCLCACALCRPVSFVFLHIYKSIKTNFTIEFFEKTCPVNITLQMFCISAMILIDISLLFLYNEYVICESCWEVLFPTYQMKTGMMKKGVIVPRIVTQRARLICENSAAFVQNTSIKILSLSLSLPTAIKLCFDLFCGSPCRYLFVSVSIISQLQSQVYINKSMISSKLYCS